MPAHILNGLTVYYLTEVSVNGSNLGTRWYGQHRYAVNETLRQGSNEINVKLTTTLYNYCRTQGDNPDIRRWLKTREAEPSGLIDPVRFYMKVRDCYTISLCKDNRRLSLSI